MQTIENPIIGDRVTFLDYLAGPVSWFEPVFHWIAQKARAKGVEKELLRKYC